MCWLQNWLKFTLRNNWWHVKTDHSQFHYQTQQIQISINLVGSFLATQSFNLIHFCKFPRIDAKSSLVLMSVLYHVKLLNQNTAVHTCFGHSFMIYCFVEVYVLWDNDIYEAKVDQEIHKVTRHFCFLLLASCQTDNPVLDVGSLSEHFYISILIKSRRSILFL